MIQYVRWKRYIWIPFSDVLDVAIKVLYWVTIKNNTKAGILLYWKDKGESVS